jgi:hypothetical protein
MTSIVNQDVYPWDLGGEGFQEISVALIADKYFNLLFRHLPAVWIDIHAENFCARTEIIFPHLQRATLKYAKFQEMNIRATKLGEVPVIDFKIMVPFRNRVAGIFIKISFHVVHGFILKIINNFSIGGNNNLGRPFVPVRTSDSSLSRQPAALCFGDGCNGCETFF